MRWPSFFYQITLLKLNERTDGSKIYNSVFFSRSLFPNFVTVAAVILTSVLNHHSFLLWRHIFPSWTLTVIIIGRTVDQSRSHYIQKSLLWSSPVLYFLVRNFTLRWGTCYTAFCLYIVTIYLCNPVFCPNLPLYPAVYHLCTFYLFYTQWLNIDWTVRGLNPDGGQIFSFSFTQMYTRSFRATKRPERIAKHPPVLSPRLRIGWSCTFVSPLRTQMHVTLWPLLIWCKFGMVTNIYTH